MARSWWVAGLVALAGAAGCGSEDETSRQGAGGSAGVGGASGAAGLAGTGGAAGTATGGTAGAAGAATGGTGGGTGGTGGSTGGTGGGTGGSTGGTGGSTGGTGGSTGGTGGSAAGTGGTAGLDGGAGSAGVGGAAGAAGAAGADGGVIVNPGVEIDFDPQGIPVASAFSAGVQAGDTAAQQTILWTRYTGTATVTVRVYAPGAPGKVQLYHEANVTPSAEGYVHADALDLPPHTELFYVFLEGDGTTFTGRSAIGRFVTAPLPGSRPVVRFGGSSCIDPDMRPFETLTRAGGEQFDFFMLDGDNIYNDPVTTLPEYRSRWLTQLADPGYQALLTSTSHYATWDDHEVDNDWDPETMAPTRIAAATTSFFESLAIRRHPTSPNRVWRSYRWGDTLEVFVLDSRSERLPSTRSTANAQYVSPEQLTWLQQGLRASRATFKIIMNSVPITNMPLVWDFAPADRWEGYAAQRQALLDYITGNSIRGVLFVAGDFHLAFSATVEPTGPASAIREVLVGPGDQSSNPLSLTLNPPQFDFRTGESNLTIFEADPTTAPPSMRIRWVRADGSVIYENTYTNL